MIYLHLDQELRNMIQCHFLNGDLSSLQLEKIKINLQYSINNSTNAFIQVYIHTQQTRMDKTALANVKSLYHGTWQNQ